MFFDFKSKVQSIFDFYKSSASIKEAYLRSIDIGDGDVLLPVGYCHQNDDDLINKLTNWRNKNVTVFPTQFLAENKSTKKWLKATVLDNPGRILFLVVNSSGVSVGHIGFNNCTSDDQSFEIDNVIRGDSQSKGIFSKALNGICEWARTILPVNSFHLRVMNENVTAISFYERNGWIKDKLIPLKKTVENGIVSYVETNQFENADAQFLRMIYSPKVNPSESLILTAGPSISALESSYAYDAAKYGWNSSWSKYLSRFEHEFAEYVGADYALATSSCTGALQIALMTLDIGPGDEVIVPDETWVATANAVRYVGATPVFADIELDSWNIDAKSVENLITSKTKAIMPVHMYGHPARMDAIVNLAKKFDLYIVEDAAPAIGAEWKGQRCGTFGDFAGFSFQGAKLLVTGEGGMLVTSNKDLYEKAKKIWDQGRNPNKVFWIDADGVKFKMSNVQAAIGLGQIQRADELIEMKRRVFSWYEEGLAEVPGVHLNKEVEGARSIYWMSSIYLDQSIDISREHLIDSLRKQNVDTRPVFPAISQYPIWPCKQETQPTALLVGQRAMNLPSGVCLRRDEVMYACEKIREILGK